ncbi:MAG: helix-turn-helix transcriptional regulator [Clostridia bacterium]|nr:helix-turn-helix transcriptional regulator [Clostridia bacterium]
MSVSKNLKVFEYKNKSYQFDTKKFDVITKQYKNKKRMTLIEIEWLIARKINISEDAVRNWRYGKNGPSSLEIIEGISEVLGLKDLTSLLVEFEGEKKMVVISDREKIALKKIYDSIVDFLYEFAETDGFELVMDDIKNGNKCEFTENMYDEISKKLSNVYRTYNKEYFDLGKHKVYNELNEYINNYVYDMFDGKIIFENGKTVVKPSELTADEEYANALSALNCIIDKYV